MDRHQLLLLALGSILATGSAACGTDPDPGRDGGARDGAPEDATSGGDAGMRDMTLPPCDPPASGSAWVCGTWQLGPLERSLDSAPASCTIQMFGPTRSLFFEVGFSTQRVNLSQLTLEERGVLGTVPAVGLLADAGDEVQGTFPGSDRGRCALDPILSFWSDEVDGVAFRAVGECSAGTGVDRLEGTFSLVVRGCR